MAETNHTALGRGIKLYTDSMRALIRQRLGAVFPGRWWQEGVLNALTQTQRSNIERDFNKNPQMDRIDLIDPGHMVPDCN